MPAAASKDRSWTWTDLVGIAALTGATLEPGRADDPGARTLYFDAVAADAAEAPGEGEGAGRKLHPMVAASEAAHALEAQKRCASTTEPSFAHGLSALGRRDITAPQPRMLGSYGHFPVTPWKHQVYAATWFSLSAGITLLHLTSSRIHGKRGFLGLAARRR